VRPVVRIDSDCNEGAGHNFERVQQAQKSKFKNDTNEPTMSLKTKDRVFLTHDVIEKA
jgi:hypothetical protein